MLHKACRQENIWKVLKQEKSAGARLRKTFDGDVGHSAICGVEENHMDHVRLTDPTVFGTDAQLSPYGRRGVH